MQSITKLDLNLQHPNYTTTMHAAQNDRLSRKIEATFADGATIWTPPQGALAMVRFAKPDGTTGFYDTDENGNSAITWQGNVATIMLAEQMLTVAGAVLCQINFYTADEEKLSAFTFKIMVEASPIDDDTLVSENYFNILTVRISDLMNAVVNPPQISTAGTWLLWDTETSTYVDSGVSAGGVNISSVTKKSGTGEPGTTDTYQCNLSSGGVAGEFTVYNGANGADGAQGAQGAKGDTGEPGVSMTGIEKISGTGAGGSVDVYEVEMSNGQSGGTFSVYNGNDGQGSPGSMTPLMDGTATAGSASAYSREDHVHPHDDTKVDAVTGKGLSTNDFTDAEKTKLEGIAAGATANTAATATPQMDGTAAVGSSVKYAREDHVHPTDTTKQDKNIYQQNVAASSWAQQATPTYTGYSYRCAIPITGVTSSMFAMVVFDPTQVASGNYAPVCDTYDGGVFVYSKVNTSITIPTIAVFR